MIFKIFEIHPIVIIIMIIIIIISSSVQFSYTTFRLSLFHT